MSMVSTSEPRKQHFEGYEKKSKKVLKRKVCLDTVNENAEDINEVPALERYITGSDETQSVPPLKKRRKKEKVLQAVKQQGQDSREETEEAQSMPPLKKSKKKEKLLQNVKQQVQDSREKIQDNEQERSLERRKFLKFNLESSGMSSDQEKRKPEDRDKDPIVNGTKEDKAAKKPSDTTWVQKASWKSLVGETGRVSFSLGSMVGQNPSLSQGGITASRRMGFTLPSADVPLSNDVNAWIEGSSSAPLSEHASQSNGHLSFSHVKNPSKLIKTSEIQSDSETMNQQSVRSPDVQSSSKQKPRKLEGRQHENMESLDVKQAGQSDHENGAEKVCRFMRSDDYEQEWLAAKRAVKDVFKRSRKDAVRSMKMFHKKHDQ